MSEPMTLTDEYVYRIAPDGKSVKAAQGLVLVSDQLCGTDGGGLPADRVELGGHRGLHARVVVDHEHPTACAGAGFKAGHAWLATAGSERPGWTRYG